MNRKLRILIADDHALVRIGLTSVIGAEKDMEVCGQASTGAQAVELYRTLRPDVVLMDLRLPDLSGVQATVTIRGQFPDARIVVISSFTPDEEIYSVIAAGAQAYVVKTTEAEEILKVIRTVAGGGRHIPGDIAARLASRIPQSELTDRERDVLKLLVRGLRNRAIAEGLGISEVTVKSHVGNILLKLGVADRTAAATVAIERGIVTLD
jgi:DNA-binding NarL/FixJ family response regulator